MRRILMSSLFFWITLTLCKSYIKPELKMLHLINKNLLQQRILQRRDVASVEHATNSSESYDSATKELNLNQTSTTSYPIISKNVSTSILPNVNSSTNYVETNTEYSNISSTNKNATEFETVTKPKTTPIPLTSNSVILEQTTKNIMDASNHTSEIFAESTTLHDSNMSTNVSLESITKTVSFTTILPNNNTQTTVQITENQSSIVLSNNPVTTTQSIENQSTIFMGSSIAEQSINTSYFNTSNTTSTVESTSVANITEETDRPGNDTGHQITRQTTKSSFTSSTGMPVTQKENVTTPLIHHNKTTTTEPIIENLTTPVKVTDENVSYTLNYTTHIYSSTESSLSSENVTEDGTTSQYNQTIATTSETPEEQTNTSTTSYYNISTTPSLYYNTSTTEEEANESTMTTASSEKTIPYMNYSTTLSSKSYENSTEYDNSTYQTTTNSTLIPLNVTGGNESTVVPGITTPTPPSTTVSSDLCKSMQDICEKENKVCMVFNGTAICKCSNIHYSINNTCTLAHNVYDMKFTLNQTYDEDLSKSESEAYAELYNRVLELVNAALAEKNIQVSEITFLKGSIDVIVKLVSGQNYKSTDLSTSLKNYLSSDSCKNSPLCNQIESSKHIEDVDMCSYMSCPKYSICIHPENQSPSCYCFIKPSHKGENDTSACPNPCENNQCVNGKCVATMESPFYTCRCDDDYNGEHCELQNTKEIALLNTLYIVGGVGGGCIFLLLCCIICMCCVKNRSHPTLNDRYEEPSYNSIKLSKLHNFQGGLRAHLSQEHICEDKDLNGYEELESSSLRNSRLSTFQRKQPRREDSGIDNPILGRSHDYYQ